MSLNAGSGYPNSAQTGCAAGRPHWPAHGGGVAACALAGHAASSTSVRRTFFTTPALDTRRAARRRPVLRCIYGRLAFVQRRIDLGDLGCLDLLVRRAAVAAGL